MLACPSRWVLEQPRPWGPALCRPQQGHSGRPGRPPLLPAGQDDQPLIHYILTSSTRWSVRRRWEMVWIEATGESGTVSFSVRLSRRRAPGASHDMESSPFSPYGMILPGFMMSCGIERRLDLAHHREAGAELVLEVLHLALADAVLAGAGAAHGQRARDQPLQEALRPPRPRPGRSCRPSAGRGSCRRRRGRRSARSARVRLMSACVSRTHSASREIGTQTSVASASLPGQAPFTDQ